MRREAEAGDYHGFESRSPAPIAVFGKCYWLGSEQFDKKNWITLRFTPSQSGQKIGTLDAADFEM